MGTADRRGVDFLYGGFIAHHSASNDVHFSMTDYMEAWFWIAYAAILLRSLLALGWLFFRNWSTFFEALWFDLIPDLISLFRGQLARDWWAEFRLHMFVLTGLVVAVVEHGWVEVVFERMAN